jgi:hypothetical protein
MDCSKLTTGLIAAVCAQAETAGINSAIVILSYSDIDRDLSVLSSINDSITNVALLAGKYGYYFESIEDSHIGEVALSKGAWLSEFDHTLNTRIFVKTEAAKAYLNSLKGARVTVLVFNKAECVNPLVVEASGNILTTDELITGLDVLALTNLVPNMTITKVSGAGALTGIPTIISIDNNTQVTMSAHAATSGAITVSFAGTIQTKWEVYGWDAGLVVTEVTMTTEMTDKVVYSIKMASSDNSKEQTLPRSIRNITAGIESSQTMVEGLLPPA